MKLLSMDLETTGLSPWAEDARILTMATWDQAGGLVGVPGGDTWPEMVALLSDPENVVFMHNGIGFDVPYYEAHVGEIQATVWDTRVAQALVDETGESNSLAALAEKYCGIELDQGMKAKRTKLADMPIELVEQYNLDDAKATYMVGLTLYDMLEMGELLPLMDWLMGVGRHLTRMVGKGVLIDRKWVSDQGQAISREIERLHNEVNTSMGRRPDLDQSLLPEGVPPLINLGSPHQLRELLFEELEMDPEGIKTTKTGLPSLGAPQMRQIQRRFKKGPARDWFQKILDWRELTKLKGTYLEPLVGKHMGSDGRVHTVYHLGRGYGAGGKRGGTVTGRLSSSDPNLQNIPRDYRVKGAFIPTAGWRMWEADYAQLEVRVAAWYAGEEKMLNAFAQNRDIHTAALAEVEGRDYDEVVELVASGDKHWKEQRALIKRITFGTLYGASAAKIKEMLADMGVFVSFYRAEEMRKKWFATYDRLAAWMQAVENQIRAVQQVSTPTGRTRHLPEILSPQAGERAAALRQGVNFMVQSLASDVTLTALSLVGEHMHYQSGQRLMMTVHDSLVGEYAYQSVEDGYLRATLTNLMVGATNNDLQQRWGMEPLPLAIDISTGLTRWGE